MEESEKPEELQEPEMPGLVIKRMLEDRGWTQADLAFIMGRQQPEVSALVSGKRAISKDIAQELGSAFGNEPSFWLALEAAFKMGAAPAPTNDSLVVRRRKLYERFPVRDMIKRGWIEATPEVGELEKRICTFFGINSVEETPQLAHAARKSTAYSDVTASQLAWMSRVRRLAHFPTMGRFSQDAVVEAIEGLRQLLADPDDVRHIPNILSEAGIRFVLVEALPGSRIDGVTTWLDDQSPVIGLSTRIDSIGGLWHSLFHEIDHVAHEEGRSSPMLDVGIVGEERLPDIRPKNEIRADAFASNASIKKADLDNFIARIRPLYSSARIKAFASRIHVHPGIVVGQLQHRGEFKYSFFTELRVKVRHLLIHSAVADGWGTKPSISSK